MRMNLVMAAAGLVFVAGWPAEGQQGDRVIVTGASVPMAGTSAGQALTREMVERMGETLMLDELQLEVALELFRDMADTRQALGDVMRQGIGKARDLAEEGDITKMLAHVKELTGAHQSAVEALEQTYLQDLRAMLSPEQEVAWSKADRLHRRGKYMGSLTRSRARVDLDDLVRTDFADAYDRPDVADVLDRWATQVDGLLVERAGKAEVIGGGPGFQGSVAFIVAEEDPYEPLRAIDARIASASEQAVRTLESVLEDDSIRRAWVRGAFARVHRQTDGERRLEAALTLDDLATDQHEQLRAVADQHGRDVGVARDRWVDAENEHESEDKLPPGMLLVIHGQETTPRDLARQAVEDLDMRLEEKLASILSDEQVARLPAASENAEEVGTVPPGGMGRSIRIGG